MVNRKSPRLCRASSPRDISRPDPLPEPLRAGEKDVTGGAEHRGRLESIAHLWARAAHDLRQPVQAALLLTRMLDDASGPGELKRMAGHIEATLKSLHGMFDVLALLSRIEGGLQTVPLRTCELADVLKSTMRETATIATERRIRLCFQNIRGPIRSHPKLLADVVRSLVLNAIKFADGDEIVAACRRRGRQLRLEVFFKGSGLDNADERSAFIQLSPRGDGPSAGQLGLGLALMERLCDRLGHTLQYDKASPDGRVLALVLRPATNR